MTTPKPFLVNAYGKGERRITLWDFATSPPHLFGFAAGICIIAAIVQACRSEIKSGWLLGALFFVCAVLAYFPQLESIQAFRVDVKLRKSLDRAEEILDRLKHLSVISAKSSYMALAWSNRWGSPAAIDKQVVLDQIDEQLADLKITPEEHREITRPYVQLIGVDLYSVFHTVMERFIQWKEGHLTQSDPSLNQTFSSDVTKWRNRSWPGPLRELKKYDLEAELDIATPTEILNEEERQRARAFKDEIVALYNACKQKGGYTHQAAEFVDKYGHDPLGGADRKMAEIFGVAFDKPK